MKRCWAWVMIIWLCLSGLAGATPIEVVVSIPPVKYFVNKIAGDKAEVEVLLPPGRNPAVFEPTPLQVRKLRRASIYFAIGLPFEEKWINGAKGINPHIRVVSLYKVIKRMPMRGNVKGIRNKERFLDPHIWLSPALVRIISHEILHSFVQLDPPETNFYLKRYYAFASEIDKVDMDILKVLAGIKKRHFMVFHPCWGYFARDYGLVQLSIEVEGKEPGPLQLSRIIDAAKNYNIHTIFVQPQFSKKMAKVVAGYINGRVNVLDPLREDWAKNMEEVARVLSRSLKGD